MNPAPDLEGVVALALLGRLPGAECGTRWVSDGAGSSCLHIAVRLPARPHEITLRVSDGAGSSRLADESRVSDGAGWFVESPARAREKRTSTTRQSDTAEGD